MTRGRCPSARATLQWMTALRLATALHLATALRFAAGRHFRFHRGGLSVRDGFFDVFLVSFASAAEVWFQLRRGGFSVWTDLSTSPSAGPKREPRVALFGFSLLTAIGAAGPAHPQHGSGCGLKTVPRQLDRRVARVCVGRRGPGFLAQGMIVSWRRRTKARRVAWVEDIPPIHAASSARVCVGR